MQQFQNAALLRQSYAVLNNKTRTNTRNFQNRSGDDHDTREIQLQLDMRNQRRSGDIDTAKNSPSYNAGEAELSPKSTIQENSVLEESR